MEILDYQEQIKRRRILVTGVVLQAITDHQECLRELGVEQAMLQDPARWILSDDERPFGFVWCCGGFNWCLNLAHICL